MPVGEGGLIVGIAVAAKSLKQDCEVIGVQTKASSKMYESWKKGSFVHVEETDTLAEAFLGGVEDGSVTLDLALKYVDKMLLVMENTLRDAIRILWTEEKQVVEGAGATSIGPLLENPEYFKGKAIVSIVSSGNIEKTLFENITKQ